MKRLFKKSSKTLEWNTEDHVRGTIYGNCIGDAIGLLTEFMNKSEANKYYGKQKTLNYADKVPDMHRSRWETGDWTDDSDQMILIIQSLLDNSGHINVKDYAARLVKWMKSGFPEFGDLAGMGIGANTRNVLTHKHYLDNPHSAAYDVWDGGGRTAAPNGGVMRTSILGVHHYWSLSDVVQNTRDICKTTHADPRCQASCVAVTVAIATMLKRDARHVDKHGKYNIGVIMNDAFESAKQCLPSDDMHEELRKHIYVSSLKDLNLAEHGKIGYAYKCMGSGFWALQQDNFSKAITKLVMEAGDADTNGAVAGAMLGCKLGVHSLPQIWISGLKHKEWLDELVERYVSLLRSLRGDSEVDVGETSGVTT